MQVDVLQLLKTNSFILEDATVILDLQSLEWTGLRNGETKLIIGMSAITEAGIAKLKPSWQHDVLGTCFDTAIHPLLKVATQLRVRYTIGVVPAPPEARSTYRIQAVLRGVQSTLPAMTSSRWGAPWTALAEEACACPVSEGR